MTTIGERMDYSKQHYRPGNIVNGQKIKELREYKGWSLQELASRTDLTPENLERIERGDGNTSTGKVATLARVLGVHAGILITGVEDLMQPQKTTATIKEAPEALAFHPNRDVTLIRTFAGDGDAYLQIGELRTDIPDEILGDILHMITVYKLRNKK